MQNPQYWAEATAHLSQKCPIMAGLIARYPGEGLRPKGNSFLTLIRAISGQQISVKAADAIWARLEAAVVPLTPETVLATPDEILRNCGFSLQKINYLKNISAFFSARTIDENYWGKRDDATILTELVSIKGVGSWTAEMFLIFHLNRPDVFPVKDLGILKAIDLHYYPTARKRKTPAQYQQLAKRWAPYRTVASWYLWRALDPVPVAY
jgi:DNA-3-methyladenine glycosylase II